MLRIGVLAEARIEVGAVEDHRLPGGVRLYPDGEDARGSLGEMPADEVVAHLRDEVVAVAAGRPVSLVGIGFPGIISGGVVEESPNVPQMKGFPLAQQVRSALAAAGVDTLVRVVNNADAIAAGLAATRGYMEKLVRVWTLGDGIGFGRYPQCDEPWEAGHAVVTLDPRERYCGCGGVGHLEGIMGNRAMRLRFLDMEPEEVFAAAKAGDTRCGEFVHLWHRALAAASATNIHLEGQGRFFIAGPNAQHVDTGLLALYLHDMVKMSPLQGSFFEVVAATADVAIIGATVDSHLQ